MQEILVVELRHLEYFVAVAEELHFGRAAARLQIAQPPLSQQIRKLEEELEVQLFFRTKRHVQLTAAGEIFLEEARQTLVQAARAREMAQKASRGELGRLAIGFVGSAISEALPLLLLPFRERFPDIELTLRELTTSQQIRALRDGRIQVGILRPPISDVTLSVETLLKEPLLVALPEPHPLARQKSLPVEALAQERFIIFPRAQGPGLYDQIISLCQQAGFSLQIIQEAIQMQTILGLVAAGLGVALVPASARYLRCTGVAYCELEPSAIHVEIALAWPKDAASPTLQAFLEVAREAIKDKQAKR
jgi:DNA-binding transcriptional LysR family regulator